MSLKCARIENFDTSSISNEMLAICETNGISDEWFIEKENSFFKEKTE